MRGARCGARAERALVCWSGAEKIPLGVTTQALDQFKERIRASLKAGRFVKPGPSPENDH
jgi:hypothetical protein